MEKPLRQNNLFWCAKYYLGRDAALFVQASIKEWKHGEGGRLEYRNIFNLGWFIKIK